MWHCSKYLPRDMEQKRENHAVNWSLIRKLKTPRKEAFEHMMLEHFRQLNI